MKKWFALLLTISGALAFADDSRENFEIVFDRNRGGLYAEYVKSLRENPKLRGQINFDIDVASSGDVTGCRVRSSALQNPDLERRLCARISLMKFAPRSEAATLGKSIFFAPTH